MATDKLPAFQFYPGDWWKDPAVKMLNLEERGFWFQILLLMHESERRGILLINGKPMPESGIAVIMGLDKQKVSEILDKLTTFGVASIHQETGAFMSRRMVRDEEIRQIRKAAGIKGGNPALLNQKSTSDQKEDNHTSNQNPTPSARKMKLKIEDENEDALSSTQRQEFSGRICKMLNRTKPFTRAEHDMFDAVAVIEADLVALERFYDAARNDPDCKLPQSVETILGGWQRTLDRAANYKPKNGNGNKPPTKTTYYG